jgi:hypothetical protein
MCKSCCDSTNKLQNHKRKSRDARQTFIRKIKRLVDCSYEKFQEMKQEEQNRVKIPVNLRNLEMMEEFGNDESERLPKYKYNSAVTIEWPQESRKISGWQHCTRRGFQEESHQPQSFQDFCLFEIVSKRKMTNPESVELLKGSGQ